MRKIAPRLLFVTAALAVTTTPLRAAAADVAASSVDLLQLFDRGTKSLLGDAAESPHATTPEHAPARRGDATAIDPAQPLVVLVPRASVLVRDWRGSMRVAGQTTITDDLRPSASYRMAVARASSSGRLAPYAQVGAGQWRLDPVLFPSRSCEERLAGQLAGGVELRASSRVRVAAEGAYTFVYREPSTEPGPRFATFVLAARATF